MPQGSYDFLSQYSAVSETELINSFYQLLTKSQTFQRITKDIYDSGLEVTIAVNDGNRPEFQDPNPEEPSRPDIYAKTYNTGSGTALIAISDQFLQENNYYTDYGNQIHAPHSLERVLAHEILHVLEIALGNTTDEELTAQLENQIMSEVFPDPEIEKPRDGDPNASQPTYDGSTVAVSSHSIITHAYEYDGSDIPAEYRAFLAQFEAIRIARDPLIVDLDDNGFSARVGHDVYFDMDSNGYAELLSTWVSSNDGLIVWDENGNGRADNGTELFGDNRSDAWGNISVHDLNADNKIDAADAIWTDLHVWQDKNSDGFTQSHEWFTLDDLGVTQINIPAGGGLGSLDMAGNNLRVQAETFIGDTRNTRYSGDVDFKFEAFFLPEIRGYNTLADLRIEMSLNAALLTNVQALAAQPTADVFEGFTTFRSDFTNMMFKWAGVENIAANSRGEFLSDARLLAFTEVYLGGDFFQARFPEANPLSLAAISIENVFGQIRDSMMNKFIYQSGGNTLFVNEGSYDLATDSIIFEGGAALLSATALNDFGTEGASSPDALAYWAGIAKFIDGVREGLDDFTTTELNALNAAIALSDNTLDWDTVKTARFDTVDVNLTGDDAVNDFLVGGSGNDTLNGLDGDDTLQGNAGNDVLQGGSGADDIQGGGGNDTLRDGSGSDLIQGGLGDDTYIWEGGAQDFIFDEGGFDVIRVSNHNNIKFERVFGSDLQLRDGSNYITLQNQLADPSLRFDTIEEIQDLSGNTVIDFNNFDEQIITNGTNNDDTILGVEYGGGIGDIIYGNGGNDIILGGAGDDEIYGGDGDDELQSHLHPKKIALAINAGAIDLNMKKGGFNQNNLIGNYVVNSYSGIRTFAGIWSPSVRFLIMFKLSPLFLFRTSETLLLEPKN